MRTPPIMSSVGGAKALSLVIGGFITSAMFVVIPLTQFASEFRLDEEIRVLTRVKPTPPPPEIEPFVEPEEEKQEEEEPIELEKEAKKLSLAAINMVLNVGSGGSGVDIYVGSFEVNNEDINLNITFEISELDKAPIPLMQVAPMYPSAMKRANVRGYVTAEFIVTKEGRVVRIEITKFSHSEFVNPVVEALRRWQFEPGIKDNVPVNTRVRIPFTFNVDST